LLLQRLDFPRGDERRQSPEFVLHLGQRGRIGIRGLLGGHPRTPAVRCPVGRRRYGGQASVARGHRCGVPGMVPGTAVTRCRNAAYSVHAASATNHSNAHIGIETPKIASTLAHSPEPSRAVASACIGPNASTMKSRLMLVHCGTSSGGSDWI